VNIERKGTDGNTAAAVASVEVLIGSSIPEQYRQWLIESGGGWVEEVIVPGTGDNGLLYEFLSPRDIENERTSRGGFSTFVPERYLIIGVGAGGCLAIGLTVEVQGAFYWADSDKAIDLDLQDSSSEDIMLRLAADWTDLLAVLDLND